MSQLPTTAFVLGAGLGTRLKALTARLPKPLIPVCNEPLITRAFAHLAGAGVRRFIVNTHWQAEQYPKAFPEAEWKGCPLIFSHEFPEVLETAGGLKFAESHLGGDESFWVYNGDILSDLPLQQASKVHLQSENEVTLVLRSQDGPLQVSFDEQSGKVLDLGRRLCPDKEPHYLFTGIYLVAPAFLKRIPSATKLSVVPVFIDMIREGARLGGVVINEGAWWDLGARDQYLGVHKQFEAQGAPWIHPSANVAINATISGASAVGADVSIGDGAHLEDTIVWAGATIAHGSTLKRCVVTAGAFVEGTHIDADLS